MKELWTYTGADAIGGKLATDFRMPWYGDSAWDSASGRHTVFLTRNLHSCTDAEWAAKRSEWIAHHKAEGYRQTVDEPDRVAFVG